MRGAAVALMVLSGLAWGASASSTRPVSAARCRAENLKSTLFLENVGRGLLGVLILENVGRTSCALLGRSIVRLVGPGSLSLGAGHPTFPAHPRPVDSLRPGRSADVRLLWTNWCRRPPRAFVLTSPHPGGVVIAAAENVPRCLGSHAPTLLAGAFEYRA